MNFEMFNGKEAVWHGKHGKETFYFWKMLCLFIENEHFYFFEDALFIENEYHYFCKMFFLDAKPTKTLPREKLPKFFPALFIKAESLIQQTAKKKSVA